jgi:hypothetical protein
LLGLSFSQRPVGQLIATGGGDLILTYDGISSYAVSIMEFRDGLVANETQYFGDRFDPAPSRAHLVERPR